jgi:transcriptional regulator with XRE-family HTH domain
MGRALTGKPGFGSFGARLKAERIRRGFTIDKFSELTGISISSITALENRGVEPRMCALKALAQALDCSMDWLAGLED